VDHVEKCHGPVAGSGVATKNIVSVTKPVPRWCLTGLTKTQHQRVQKLRAREIEEKRKEEERDQWFNQECLMMATGKTWKQKWIEREEQGSGLGSDAESGDNQEAGTADINMVFHLPMEFALPEPEIAQLNLGAERVVFEKPEQLGQYMKPLYIKGYLDGKPMGQMLVDSGCEHYAIHHV
jgi:hypothetical protein